MIRWLRTDDGIRIRAARWEGGAQTVLLLPGRTEYIEKYEDIAAELVSRGFSVVTLDWRGQGLSDRALPDAMIGHVLSFREYQRDLAAVLPLAGDRPFMLAHSMGGCIGLRALVMGLPVRAAAFTAPMWGIPLGRFMRPLARLVAGSSPRLNRSHVLAPGTSRTTYVLEAQFAGNTLTSDEGQWNRMRDQAANAALTLGGPSLGWLNAALRETGALARLPSPAVPALVHLGTRERVVDPAPIRDRMARWPGGTLTLAEGAEHEIMMEAPAIRSAFIDAAVDLFRR
ncbi:alpha/beta hydrolase [Cereibacter sp. SYSU M97828]|nr:alpha/beta hydrolase [Cereibacter flavus]